MRTWITFQNANTENLVKKKRTSLTNRQHQLSNSSQFIERNDYASVFWSSNMACRWLNVPWPTSWTEMRTSTPRSIDEPKASAWMHNLNEWRTVTKLQTITYLCRKEIDPFTWLDALPPILDVPLQIRTEFLRPLPQIQHYPWISIVQAIKLTNPSGTAIIVLATLSSTILSAPVSGSCLAPSLAGHTIPDHLAWNFKGGGTYEATSATSASRWTL